MNKQPKLWEILAAFIPIIAGIVIWLWNLGTTVKEHGKDIEYLKQGQIEYKQDVKEMKDKMDALNEKLGAVLVRLETKEDRK